jgi:RNA polymerase sigma-70 factor (ECF subfamily)
MTDAVARAGAGDPEALGALYMQYAPSLLRLAYRICGSQEDGQDVLHDVFLGLPEALRHYVEQGQFESWLKRLTVRAALSRLRRSDRRREVQLAADSLVVVVPDEPPDEALRRAILGLSDALRIVFMLKAAEDYSHAEIATMLGISVSASEVRFHRAVRQLRASLSRLDS